MTFIGRARQAVEQLGHLAHETKRLNGSKWWRWGNVWFSDGFWAIASYRMSRSAFLAFGPAWSATRVALSPAFYAFRPWFGGCEISYRADIGRGLRILHPGLGVVISGKAVVGENLILVGGNCIGGRRALSEGDLVLGNNVTLGANACVLGPVHVGDNVRIGANAVVFRDAGDGETLAAPLAQVLGTARSS